MASFGMLFIASLLLSPDWFLGALTHRQRVWVVIRLTKRQWHGITGLFVILFLALGAWLVLNKPFEANLRPRALASSLALQIRP